jgi:hypothetical protein
MKGFAQIPNLAIAQLKGKELNLYCKVVATSYRWGFCNMSQNTLGKQIPISKPKLTQTTRDLEDKGWILTTSIPNKPIHYFPLDHKGQLMFPVKSKNAKLELMKKYGVIFFSEDKENIYIRSPKAISIAENNDTNI